MKNEIINVKNFYLSRNVKSIFRNIHYCIYFYVVYTAYKCETFSYETKNMTDVESHLLKHKAFGSGNVQM